MMKARKNKPALSAAASRDAARARRPMNRTRGRRALLLLTRVSSRDQDAASDEPWGWM